MADLDKILSGEGAAAPEPEAVVEQATPAHAAETPNEQPDAEGAEASSGTKMVPHEALHAEKQKVKRYTEEVSDFRRSNEALQRQVSELLQRIPAPPKEQQPVPDIFENAPEAIRHSVAPQFEQLTQVLMANARLVAGVKFTDEKVDEAEQAFIKAMQENKIDSADYHKVVSSPNRYAAAVQWHQRHQAQQEIGDDPAAFRAKVEAEILAKHGLTSPAEQQAKPAAAPVMPSNLATARSVGARSGPTWGGPTPLADIFSR